MKKLLLIPSVLLAMALGGCGGEAPVDTSAMTLEEKIEFAIEETKSQKDTVEITDNTDTEVADDKNIIINLDAKDNLSADMIKTGILANSTDMLEILADSDEVAQVTFNWSFPLVDNYGNESNEVIATITVDKETIDNINFENFIYVNLPDVADEYVEHPALSAAE